MILDEAALAGVEDFAAWSTSLLIILLPGPLPWIPLSRINSSVAAFFAKGEANVLPAPANEGSGVEVGLSREAGQDLFSSALAGSSFCEA